MRQLPLGLRWPAHQRFAHLPLGANGLALAAVRRTACEDGAPWVFLAGPPGSGRTHLLIAACQELSETGGSAQYLPLAGLPAPRAAAIRAFGGSQLLAIDDLDACAGDRDDEHALFDLFNRCRAEGSRLLFAAVAPPAQLGIGLPDLVSRLSSCTQVVLRPLDDDERRDVLRRRAGERGLVLDEAVLDYLFARHSRDLGSLGVLLERLDRESLAAQRRITVPFLRQFLAEPRGPAGP